MPKDKYEFLSFIMFILVTLLYFSNIIWLYLIGVLIAGWYFYYLNKTLIKEVLNKKNYAFIHKIRNKLFRRGD